MSLSESGSAANFIELAVSEIESSYGDIVKVGRKSLHKFGRGESLGTSETEIFSLNQNETYVSTNAIDSISSSSGSDTNEIAYEGMTVSGGNFTFVSGTVTLSGQTKVSLPTAVARLIRAYVNDGANLVGDCYFYEDSAITSGVPDDLTKVHNHIPAGDNQSLKAGTTIASTNYFLVTSAWAFVNKKTTASADIRFKVRPQGGVFKTQAVGSLSNSNGGFQLNFAPYAIIPPNADIFITAQCSTTAVDVSAGFMGMFADVMS